IGAQLASPRPHTKKINLMAFLAWGGLTNRVCISIYKLTGCKTIDNYLSLTHNVAKIAILCVFIINQNLE
ncbi:hypothetical protein Q6256_27940, partial [Klebsiella pneumoniae]|uniref:hypothetical protein n=1 Tax=Klebsiella pneumoniae TaxID=573 RepID=UPI00272F79BA